MSRNPINSYSLKWSCSLHGLLLFSAALIPYLPQFRPREMPVVTEFTVVLEENLVEPVSSSQPPVQTPDPRPPEPVPRPDPKPPEALPEPKDAIDIKPKPPKEPPKETPKEPPPKKPEFQKGKRVELPPDKKQPDFSKTYKRVTEPALSREEIKRLLNDGAKPGTRNQVPQDEASRCFSIIKGALYNAWDQPGSADAGRVARLEIRLDSTGRIVSYRISQSSGNAAFDQTVLKAAASCPPIRGLSVAFLKRYEVLIMEFKLE